MNFYTNNKTGERGICFVTGKKYRKRLRKVHLKTIKKINRDRIKDLIQYIKSKFPCLDCGTQKDLTFDHVRGKKVLPIAAGPKYTWTQVNRELLKCEIVCRRCHDKREMVRYILQDGLPDFWFHNIRIENSSCTIFDQIIYKNPDMAELVDAGDLKKRKNDSL